MLNIKELERRRKISESLKIQHKEGKRICSYRKIGLANSIKLKGRIVSEEVKAKIRANAKINSNYGMKGKIRTEESNKKGVETRMKNGSYKWTKEMIFNAKQRKPSIETRQKISKSTTGIKKGPMKEETKQKFRIIMSNRIIKRGNQTFGKNEKKILDELEKLFRYKIIRQYSIIGYLLDGYIKQLNLAIEIDEFHHLNKYEYNKDIERQNRIENELDCKFLRIIDKYN